MLPLAEPRNSLPPMESATGDHLWNVSGPQVPSRMGDVVFLHGLDGNLRTTWQADNGLSFPEMLAEDLPRFAIWSVGYDVSPSAWKGNTMPLVDRATNILAMLEANGFGKRPIIFITHSLGGLVVKQMLRHAVGYGKPAWNAIAQKTKGVVFISTPHAGSGLATWLSYMQFLLPSVTVQELKEHEPYLRDLNVWYRNAVNEGTPKIANVGFFEKRLTHGLSVVNATSADLGVPGEIPIPIDADHASICKPESKSVTLYKLVKRFVETNLNLSDVPVDIFGHETHQPETAERRSEERRSATRIEERVERVQQDRPESRAERLSTPGSALSPEELSKTMSNPKYAEDISKLDLLFDRQSVINLETILIIVGTSVIAELLDRPVAEILRDRIDERGGMFQFQRAVVLTDAAWYSEKEKWILSRNPIIAVGGPGNNEVSAEFSEWVPAPGSREGTYPMLGTLTGFFRLNELKLPQVGLWGATATATRRAVEHYIVNPNGLNEFLGICWKPR